MIYFLIISILSDQSQTFDDYTPTKKWPSPMRTWPNSPIPKQTWPTDPIPWKINPTKSNYPQTITNSNSQKSFFNQPLILFSLILFSILIIIFSIIFIYKKKIQKEFHSTSSIPLLNVIEE